MRPILDHAQSEVLAELAQADTLIALDFDGTLAPIVRDRDRATMRPSTKELLFALCVRHPCAVISGRSRDDVKARLEGAPVRHVVGNHGLEPSARMDEFEATMDLVRPRLAAALAGVAGVELEDKRYSLAIHYRGPHVQTSALIAIEAAITALPVGLRRVPGKLVMNLLPEGAPHKGIAVAELRVRAQARHALYVGDDVTDEDVFEMERPGALVGVRVGFRASSSASYFINDQLEIDLLLARLIDGAACER